MTTLLKIQRNGQMTLPSQFRTALGVAEGDIVEATMQGSSIVLTLIDRTKLPNADGEYTPVQRKLIDERLAKADQDIQEGRLLGPFDTHAEMISFLHGQVEQSKRKPKKPSKR